MNNKKSVYVWVILVLFIIGAIGSLWSLFSGLFNINALLTPSLLSNPTANIIRLSLHLVDLCLSLTFLYKLYNFKHDVIKWTHIIFSYFIVNLFLQVILTPNILFAILAFIPFIVMSIITIIIWVTFVKHLKKQNIANLNIPVVIDNSNNDIENSKKIKKIASFKFWIKENKKLVIILSIIIFVTIIIPVSMILGVKFMSQNKCGEGGYLNGNSKIGYNCSYQIVKPEYTHISQCLSSAAFCESKGKIKSNNACISGGVDLTNAIKYDEEKGFSIEEGPVVCDYCCSLSDYKNTDGTFKYDPNGPIPSPIVDDINKINARGEKVDKFVKGTFKNVDTGEIFEYSEKYEEGSFKLGDESFNTVNHMVTHPSERGSFVYFKDISDKNKIKALFNENDYPLTGVITDVYFSNILDHKKTLSEPLPREADSYVIYNIKYKLNDKIINKEFMAYLCSEQNTNHSGLYCVSSVLNKNDEVIFLSDSFGPETAYIDGIYLASDTTKAELLKYQYYNVPDTGQILPVFEVEK